MPSDCAKLTCILKAMTYLWLLHRHRVLVVAFQSHITAEETQVLEFLWLLGPWIPGPQVPRSSAIVP